MPRLLVLLLVLLNAGYFAWSQGLLRAYGFAPVLQTENASIGTVIENRRIVEPCLSIMLPWLGSHSCFCDNKLA